MSDTHESNLLNTVVKALDVMECLANSSQTMTASDIAKQCGMSRPTVYRILTTLESRGYVTNDEHNYALGTMILSLSRGVLESLDLANTAYPYLRQLSQLSGETTYVSMLDDAEILYINKVESTQSIRSNCTIGTRNPLYCTSMGNAILAFLPDEERDTLLDYLKLQPRTSRTVTDRAQLIAKLEKVRAQGFALDDEEIEDNVRCIGAPILNHMGYPFAAISLSGPAFRLPLERLEELSISLLDISKTLSQEFGYRPVESRNGTDKS